MPAIENTYRHPDSTNIRFHGIGTPPPWAVDVQPYVAPLPHPSDKYFTNTDLVDKGRVNEIWDRMTALGVKDQDIVALLNIHSIDVVSGNY